MLNRPELFRFWVVLDRLDLPYCYPKGTKERMRLTTALTIDELRASLCLGPIRPTVRAPRCVPFLRQEVSRFRRGNDGPKHSEAFLSELQRQPFDPDDSAMRAWLQQERRHSGFLPDAKFRDIGKVVVFRVESLKDAQHHAVFSLKYGVRSHSQAQFARNMLYQHALIETRGNLRKAAEILKVSPGAIAQARLAMKLGAEFHQKHKQFEQEDRLAMSPMPEIRMSNGPQFLFDRYAKCWPEAINRARNLLGNTLSDTAAFLLMDLCTRSRPDRTQGDSKAVSWAFHVFSDPREWLGHTGLGRSQFYRALRQLRDAGFIFKHGHRHWVVAYQGPMFKWLCQQGFVASEALADNECVEAIAPGLIEDAVETYDLLVDFQDYRVMRMRAKINDYLEFVFSSVRRTLRVIRDIAVQVYIRTKRLLDYVGVGDRGLSMEAHSDPDPPGHATDGSKLTKSSLSIM